MEESSTSQWMPAKKIKLSEINNLDPMKYFSRFLDIPEMIAQHLNGEDLIKISEVSPSCYNFIASSKDFMKKIKVVFDGDRVLYPEDQDLLKNGSRFYQSIEVRRRFISKDEPEEDIREVSYGDYISSSEFGFFYNKAREWKEVTLKDVFFKTKLDLWKFLSSIESSVESLSICNKSSPDCYDIELLKDESFEALKFPKLKKLKLSFENHSWMSITYGEILSNSVAIEEYEFEYGDDRNTNNIFTKMLGNFDKLTSLMLRSKSLYGYLFLPWERFQFKLKRLKIIFLGKYTIIEGVLIYAPAMFTQEYDWISFLNFLKSQNDHLEDLTIEGEFDKELFKMILKMPKLKSLCLQDYDKWIYQTEYYFDFLLQISTSIINLTFIRSVFVERLKLFFDVMPNVKRLSLSTIDENTMKMITNLKETKCFKVYELITDNKNKILEREVLFP